MPPVVMKPDASLSPSVQPRTTSTTSCWISRRLGKAPTLSALSELNLAYAASATRHHLVAREVGEAERPALLPRHVVPLHPIEIGEDVVGLSTVAGQNHRRSL